MKKKLTSLALVGAFLGLSWYGNVQAQESSGNKIHFINVQEGGSDAIILESNGHFAMVDTGEDYDFPDGSDSRYPWREEIETSYKHVLTDRVFRRLKELGVQKLDFILVTHTHSDHIGNVDELLSTYPVDRVYLKKYSDNRITNSERLWDNLYGYDKVLQTASEKGVSVIQNITQGDAHFQFGDMDIQLYNYENETDSSGELKKIWDDNSNSLISVVKVNGKKIYLGGDLDNVHGAEDKYGPLIGKVDLMKFNHHHDTNKSNTKDFIKPQLFTPNLKTIQNPCLSLDPGWFLFSPNGCFLLDKKEFPLYGISVEKNTKRKETHMNSLPNHHFQNKSFYQLSFDGGHLTQYGGLIFFQELFSQLKLKERISKYLVTNDQRRYCRYSDSDILVQFLFQLLTGYGTDYACKELSADAYFPKLLEGGQLASQPTLSRFLSRTDEETVHSLRCLNLELVEFFLQFHQLNQLIVDIDSTHFTTYGKQEGVAYNAHYRAHGYHPLYAFEGKTGYCFNAQLRPGNRYCSEEADSFITPVLERFNQLLFRMDSGFATPKLYDLIEKTGQYYLIKLKKNTVLSRLGDLSLPCPQDEDLTILPHSAYSETLYQAGSWSHKRRVCQFSERKEGNLFYDVISLVTNMTSGTSQDQFQLYRGRGQAENFIKEMKEGFFGDKTDSSTLIKNEVRMMMSCIAYNLYLFLKHLAGGDFQTLTIKRFRHLFLHVVGKCVRTGRKQLLKLSSLYAYSELFSALYSRIRKVNLNLPVPYEPPRRKASLMMH